MIVQEVTTKATRLSKLIKAIHYRRGVSWRSLGRELGVSDFAVGKWRDGVSSPERKHLDSIAAHPLVNWTPQQLDLYLDGKFDDRDIEDLLDNGPPEDILPVASVKQALKQYCHADRVEILAYIADLLKTSDDENDQKKLTDSPPEIKKSKKTNKSEPSSSSDNGKNGKEDMTTYLKRFADLRLRPLLRKSLAAQGFDNDYRRAAASVLQKPKHIDLFAGILEHLATGRFDPRIGYPKIFLEALASLCCRVEHWHSDSELEIDCSSTYQGNVDLLLADLEKPANGCPVNSQS